MPEYAIDRLVFGPDDVDLSRSPLAGRIEAETFVLGAFNPGLTRLPNGNLLMMVRVAEALREPVAGGMARSIRWEHGHYALDEWPEGDVRFDDPRIFRITDDCWRVLALTSISWLLPVELSPDGLEVVAVHYDRAIEPAEAYQCYGVEDARISRVGDRWLMTTCSVSPERLSTTLYSSADAMEWTLEGIVLDHQNKDMLLFEGLIGGKYWAQTRPLGDVYFAYPPRSEWRAGPSINLASSPDALHWKPYEKPGLRPHAATVSTARMGGGAPPILTADGWLTLWHGVAPKGEVGVYRTYWSILHPEDPGRPVRSDHEALLEPSEALTAGMEDRMYLRDVVFTTGIVDGGDHYVVASGEADLACRITHIPKSVFGL
jgi:predicted GH43/DUF377 family glycosyl hydrolase